MKYSSLVVEWKYYHVGKQHGEGYKPIRVDRRGTNMRSPMINGPSTSMRYTGFSFMTPMGQKPSLQKDIEAIATAMNKSYTTRRGIFSGPPKEHGRATVAMRFS